MKEYNSGTVRWKRCMEQSMGKVLGASVPSSPGVPLSPNLSVFPNQEALHTLSLCPCGYFLKRVFICLFLETGREGEREGKKHQCVVASCMPPTGDMALYPGMCLRLGIEQVTLWLSGWQALCPLSHTSQGPCGFLWSFHYVGMID